MKIHTNTGGLAATNAYLIADETTGDAAIVDAPQNTTAPLLNVARHNKWNIRYLLLTHGHWDHTSDHKVVTDAECVVHTHGVANTKGRSQPPAAASPRN